ncbi:hypothetical protein LEP1GSC073_1724 [Leptospira noguchii str. Cascata]|nr:hypothetical protein LEP1GSC073_1724 [Leptospira noguchii str. Cascata]
MKTKPFEGFLHSIALEKAVQTHLTRVQRNKIGTDWALNFDPFRTRDSKQSKKKMLAEV